MRSVVVAASLLASSLLVTSQAAAQDPEPPPPPAAQERAAGARRAPDAARVRETERSSDSNRAPEGAVRRPARETTADAAPPARVESSGAVRRAPPSAPAPAVTNADAAAATASTDDDQRRGAVRRPSDDRDRGGRTVDRAIPRSQAPPPARTVIRNYPYYRYPNYARYYDPWGYGSFGLGYFYYSPWAWNASSGYGYGYPYPAYSGPWGYDVGAVKIKLQPRDAEVWVDGYYAGVVDDFDGVFQALRLDSGPYRIEIRKPGFETRAFDVRVQPNRTITFRGDLRPTP